MLPWHRTGEELVWVYPKQDPAMKEAIAKEFKIHPVTAEILVSRGKKSLKDVHDFLYSKLPDLHDPYLIEEMPQAVDRVCRAIKNQENILIYGDNDVDGMTGTALLTEFLQFVGANVFYYVSNRGPVRQSLIVEALEFALKSECKLLITVDCGITAATEIAKVVENKVDVIITDHHEPTDKIPDCVATLNPKLINNSYPNRDLTGVGVAFKLAHAIANQLVAEGKISSKKIDLKRYLDLVALGTISDMGVLQGENRILVHYGLQQMRKGKRIGLAKLIAISEVNISEINTFEIAAKIAPRLNSLGRITDEPQKGVQLLLVRNVAAAEKIAMELDLNNSERQKIERTMSLELESMITKSPELLEKKAIILSSHKWHPGIIAILSTRISKHYNRPTVVIAIDNEIGKGSLRSITEFPLLPALKECSDLLINYGGHDFAAGITLKESNLEEFKKRFTAIADKMLSQSDVTGKLHVDAQVKFTDLTFDFMESLTLLEPNGNGNPPPILYCEAKQAWPPKIVGPHLKLYFERDGWMLEGFAYGKAFLSPMLRKKDLLLRIAFTPQVNEFQGGQSIHLLVRDIKIIDQES